MADTTLSRDVVGLLTFALHDEDGTWLEGTEGSRLFAYLHGHENLPAALEAVLEGLGANDTFDQVVENAFGEATGREPQRIRKKDLPKNAREQAAPGLNFVAADSEGKGHRLWITQVKGSQVWVTTEHPLAGKNLRFSGVVARIRQATAAELEHGHAHGPGGHNH
ncbi:MAG: peptidylprolyl isomerase [Myxococcales bacterium]|nr:peptidylprolyl isomerase [Myxococcales bacterium]